MTGRALARRAAPLLFVSGCCALVYQIAWQRQLRLVFGASTAASAAVVAIFIAGAGAGALVLGPRADRHERPLALYARLEAIIAVGAAVTPVLVALASKIYLALGGQATLGTAGATAVRLVLSAVVLAVPTFAMGGTLPAVARAVATADDEGRARVGWLYGVNTLGAVAGCVAATFVLLEAFGTRGTLWLAACANVGIAAVARWLARELPDVPPEQAAVRAVPRLVLAAAAAVGLAFFLMELVWYRMLGPLLGGTVFTFGLILATALAGIGIGGALYARARRATPAAFALTCLLEAVFIAMPLALGDRIAELALVLREVGIALGFYGHVAAWAVVAAIAILPAAIVAGYQFPLLIGLAGRGRVAVGREVGITYAANTLGAMAGALAGGFGLVPLLGAVGCWRAVIALLVVTGVVAVVISGRRALVALAVVATVLAFARGPTAVWRHSAIGAGRVDDALPSSDNALRAWERTQRRTLVWEQDGIESAVALVDQFAYAFVINGKVDGSARFDAATAVWSGLVGAVLHGNVHRSLVIGLGTGSTAGWLAAVPGMERVDVVELEPAVLRVAQACSAINQDVLARPNVHVTIGDAREVLLASGGTWDLIVSEPSNPYRAGVSSLFTREYYAAVADRLADGGVFLQWVQSYEVDPSTVQTVYATLVRELPYVTTFRLARSDLLFVASKRPFALDAATLRARLAGEPYATALRVAWRTDGLEGFLARHVARPAFAAALAATGTPNTDDDNIVEFGFARSVGGSVGALGALRTLAHERHEDRPDIAGDVDWARVDDEALLVSTSDLSPPIAPPGLDAASAHRVAAQTRYLQHDFAGALAEWRAQSKPPRSLTELELVAHVLAEAGDDSQPDVLARLREQEPTDADLAVALRAFHDHHDEDATAALERAFVACRNDAWPSKLLLERAFAAAHALAAQDPNHASRLYAALREPFAVHLRQDARAEAALRVAIHTHGTTACVEAAHALEPDFPWQADLLALRADCYRAARDPLAELAGDELAAESAAREGTPLAR